MVTPDLPAARRAAFRGDLPLLLNKWYFDELYDALFVQPALAHRPRASGRGATARMIDGLGPDGVAARAHGHGAAR